MCSGDSCLSFISGLVRTSTRTTRHNSPDSNRSLYVYHECKFDFQLWRTKGEFSLPSSITFWWWTAVSRGRNPWPGGGQYVRRGLLSTIPSLMMPMPILLALPSSPMMVGILGLLTEAYYDLSSQMWTCKNISVYVVLKFRAISSIIEFIRC